MSLTERLEEAGVILNSAINEYKPVKIFALFSGGHDSLTSTAVSYQVLGERLDGIVHIDTGIGIPDTQKFVIDVCESESWPLLIYRAAENVKADGTPDPMIYEDIVVKHGFPGPGAHRLMYSKLKQRQIRRVVRDFKTRRSDKIMFISGVRRAESARRMGNVSEVHKDGAQIWVSPMLNFSDEDQRNLMHDWHLPRNPVKDKICMSGECLCGAFAQKGELSELRIWFPDVADRIERITENVRAAGHKKDWESGDFSVGGNPKTDNLMMCVKCENKFLSLSEEA